MNKKTRKAETRKPDETFEIRVTDLDRTKGIAEGRVIYHYSDRQTVWPRQTTKREGLTKQGYHHVKRVDQRNGRMLFVKNAKVEIEMSVFRGSEVVSYRKNITESLRKLLRKELSQDEKITPDTAAKLANKINTGRVVVFVADKQLFVAKS